MMIKRLSPLWLAASLTPALPSYAKPPIKISEKTKICTHVDVDPRAWVSKDSAKIMQFSSFLSGSLQREFKKRKFPEYNSEIDPSRYRFGQTTSKNDNFLCAQNGVIINLYYEYKSDKEIVSSVTINNNDTIIEYKSNIHHNIQHSSINNHLQYKITKLILDDIQNTGQYIVSKYFKR